MSGCMVWRHMQIVVTATMVSNPDYFTGCAGAADIQFWDTMVGSKSGTGSTDINLSWYLALHSFHTTDPAGTSHESAH